MKEQKKKRIIAILLFISCFISGYMLFISPDGGSKPLQSLAVADSLIQQELSSFNISNDQINISTIPVDSNFSRKHYRVGVPYGFSKTQLHAELNSLFFSYNIKTPARVTFPEENIDIQLMYNDTVICTISIQTDAELILNKNHISLLISFDELPDEELIADIESIGAPIPLVFKVSNPLEANTLKKQLGNTYNHILFWLQGKDGQDLINNNPQTALNKLQQLQQVLPEAQIMHFDRTNAKQSIRTQLVAQTNLTFVDASNALMLHEGLGKAAFMEELNKLQSNPSYSMGVIAGNETTLSWLSEKLPELKKAGIDISAPPKTNY